MISKFKKIKLKVRDQNSGFNLIEVVTATVILGTVLATAMPVILYSKVASLKSEERAGALIVSQKIFDSIRGRTFGTIPTVDTTETNPTTELGRNYNVTVRYCENDLANTPPNPCSTNYRQFKITVRNTTGNQTSESSIVYETEAAFTSFN
jgi:prepilin-type N-terminal cleavage/methylation domain-containing protein